MINDKELELYGPKRHIFIGSAVNYASALDFARFTHNPDYAGKKRLFTMKETVDALLDMHEVGKIVEGTIATASAITFNGDGKCVLSRVHFDDSYMDPEKICVYRPAMTDTTLDHEIQMTLWGSLIGDSVKRAPELFYLALFNQRLPVGRVIPLTVDIVSGVIRGITQFNRGVKFLYYD